MSKAGKRERERARQQRRAERRAEQAQAAGAAEAARNKATRPVRGALAPMIDLDRCWYLARTAPRLGSLGREALDKALKAQDVPAYRPRASEVVIRRGRRVVKRTPLVIRTLIVGVRDRDHLDTVAALPGVAEIVSYPVPDGSAKGNVTDGVVLRPARLDAKALQAFLIALAAGEITQPTGVGVGQSVLVVDGPFATFPAIVTEILPNDMIRVEIAIFGRPTSAVLGIAQVEPV